MIQLQIQRDFVLNPFELIETSIIYKEHTEFFKN